MSVGTRCVAIALVLGTILVATGCERPNPEPVANPAIDELYVPVDEPPDPNLANDPVVAKTKASVVKIRGLAYGCERLLTGSDFVVASRRVLSNAHVVAGAESVSVELGGTTSMIRRRVSC